MKEIGTYVRLMRVRHWLKNLFVFAPLIFSASLSRVDMMLNSLLIFIAFCFASSGVYIFNDINDLESDRHHWRKKNRPISSGAVSLKEATVVAIVCFILAFVIVLLLPLLAGLFLLIYVLENVFYTLRGKEMVVIDAFCISAGFVIRVIAGSYAIGVNPTSWILVTTFFLALFMGFGKRRNELLLFKENSDNHRKVLKLYDFRFLDYMMVSTASISVISYTLYCLDPSVISKFSTDKLVYTVPFVTYGVFRYMLLLFKDGEGDPTEVVTRDTGIAVTTVLWFLSVVMIIYLPMWF